MGQTVGVVLSGCGYLDGSEIHEAVLTLYLLERQGFSVRCFAPDKPQRDVMDHVAGQPMAQTRNVLAESARIARGQVEKLSVATMQNLDALVLPGGYGAAKNLSDVALLGAQAQVDPDLLRLIGEAVTAKKPIVAICISPVIVAVALHKLGRSAQLTIGNDEGTAQIIQTLGCSHKPCGVRDAVVDADMRVISTPAYMLGPSIHEVAQGIEAAVWALVCMLR